MNELLWARILLALGAFDDMFIKDLTNNANDVYLKESIKAQLMLKVRPDLKGITTEAQRYAKEYGKQLRTGSTIINGEEVPWLKRFSEKQRSDIYEIIKKGIEDGKTVGTKERKKGGYPKDTIANDLSEYFDQRKSHASTVARTEVGNIQSTAHLERWQKMGITHVKVHDGHDDDDACRAADGQIWTIEYAMEHLLQHPNCTRTFTPIIKGFGGN
jgi:hypothetical protein